MEIRPFIIFINLRGVLKIFPDMDKEDKDYEEKDKITQATLKAKDQN